MRVAAGLPPGSTEHLPGRARRALAVAESTGGPATAALDAAMAAVADERDVQRAALVATAQARSVARVLAGLPVLGVIGIGALVDVPLWRFYTSSAGRAVALLGAGLVMAGLATTRWLVARTTTAGPPTDEALDLVATALAAGCAPGAALRAAADVLDVGGADLRRTALALELAPDAPTPPRLAPLVGLLRAASRHGTPAVPALRRLAHDLRADERARVGAATQRLPALLTFPTVLFLLPATLLLTGAPVLASGLDALAGT